MEEVCELIANNWNAYDVVQYVEQTHEDDLKKVNSNESSVDYIVSQLNIYFGEAVYKILTDNDCSMVSFKYNGVKFSIHELYDSRGYGFWVVEVE